MLALGTHNGESYRLTQVGREVELRLSGARGVGLARALGAREHGLGGIVYLQPAKAEKWRLLFMAGFGARLRRVGGLRVWTFERGGCTHLNLAEAVRIARAEVEISVG